MAQSVVCQSCWTWWPLGDRSTCKSCGGPLLFQDGRHVAELRAAPPAQAPVAAGLAPSPAMQPAYAAAGAAPPGDYVLPRHRTNWVTVCQAITLGYGVLAMLGLILVGLVVHRIQVPLADPGTGAISYQTFDIGPAFVIGAVVLMAVCVLFAWLTQYTTARVIFLALTGLAMLSAGSRFGADMRAQGGFVWLTLTSLAVDLGYAFALLMSLINPPRRGLDA
ncbi:MAG TPA: hypothetical protein VGQ42_12465 [Candidatus Dormibacteraeota bacterium]|jgi:hypothetical protein|nr:hypothetical protein [Candidatus Dormibacteraeota bacterium]